MKELFWNVDTQYDFMRKDGALYILGAELIEPNLKLFTQYALGNKIKKLFWNVDTQYDFMRKDGALYIPGAELIEPNLKMLTQYALGNNIQIIRTGDSHYHDAKEFSDNPDFVESFPPHCIRGTKGSSFIEDIDGYVIDWKDRYVNENAYRQRNIILTKDAFDVFEGNPHTETLLKKIDPDKVYVYGVATNFCVADAAEGIAKRGYDVSIIIDATKEIPIETGYRSIDETFQRWDRLGIKRLEIRQLLN